jgi:hypothetical protein
MTGSIYPFTREWAIRSPPLSQRGFQYHRAKAAGLLCAGERLIHTRLTSVPRTDIYISGRLNLFVQGDALLQDVEVRLRNMGSLRGVLLLVEYACFEDTCLRVTLAEVIGIL